MGSKTNIAWCDHTFNPWRGCTRVSEGCRNCYAETMSKRNSLVLGIWGPNGTRVMASQDMWHEPIVWNRQVRKERRRSRVFCASMADVFEDFGGSVKDHKGDTLFVQSRMGADAHETILLARREASLNDIRGLLWELIEKTTHLDWLLLTKRPENISRMMPPGDWPNVWLGVSVENQNNLWRVDALIDAPCQVPVRFISYEPALGPLDCPELNLTGIDWVIYGGESGPGHRPDSNRWAWDVYQRCRKDMVAFFYKQSSGSKPGMNAELYGMKIQEFPKRSNT